jgi:MerR family redox-sensitive transcriptional activator SoxR
MSDKSWSVGMVAKRCGINISTLHFYETKGLICSRRNSGNQRRYEKDVIRRVSLIKAAQKMGISLSEIKQALGTLPPHGSPSQKQWKQMAKVWKSALDARIGHLERLRGLVDGCIGCGCLSMKSCPLNNKDDYLAEKGPGPVILDAR